MGTITTAHRKAEGPVPATVRNEGREQVEKIMAAPRKKPWLSILWPWIAAGALMGLMSGAIFFLMGTTALQQGERELGIGYMALATIFPPGTIAAAWWMGRD